MIEGIILPVIVESINSLKDGSVSIKLSTQELRASQAGQVFELRNKLCVAYLSPKETISQKELAQIDALQPEMQGKTKSQRQRSVLYLIWQNNNEGHRTFDTYYMYRMERIIENLKAEIDQV